MRLFALFIFVAAITLSLSSRAQKNSDEGDILDRAKKATKRIVKGVKKGGKEVGKGVQEVFDPNDEDLQADRKKKKDPKEE